VAAYAARESAAPFPMTAKIPSENPPA